MHKIEKKRFLFRAHGVAASGRLTKPSNEFIDAQASSALPVNGGMASAQVENFAFRNILSFARARTDLVGTFSPDEGAYNTLITTSVEKLSILGVLTADRVVCRLASRHLADGNEASIITLGSQIENLRVGGTEIPLGLDFPLLLQHNTAAKVRDAKLAGIQDYNGIILTSIFNKVGPVPGLSIEGNRIDIEQFGSISLGEIFISRNERRITMIRVALGCAADGDLDLNTVDGNGDSYPP
jgi:hypothetical protein